MRSKTLLSISLLSIAALTNACSRHKVAAAPSPSTTAAADKAAMDAAARENAKPEARGNRDALLHGSWHRCFEAQGSRLRRGASRLHRQPRGRLPCQESARRVRDSIRVLIF